MKKMYVLAIIFFMINTNGYSQDIYNSEKTSEQKEINLDVNITCPEYNLKKPEIKDNTEIKSQNYDELPLDMITNPIKLLRQYCADEY